MTAFLRPRRTADPRWRLAVVHHAGGSAASYSPLARRMPADCDVVLVELPGRGVRAGEPLCADLTELVARVSDDLLELDATDPAPLHLFGHSMGAVVAAEVAVALAGTTAPVRWLGVSGRLAPGITAPHTGHRAPLHTLDDHALLAELAGLGGIPAELRELPGFLERFLRTARADFTALAGHRRQPGDLRLGCPVSAFGGYDDPWAPPALMQHWSATTDGGYTQTFLPGGHFYWATDSGVGLAERIALAAGSAQRDLRPIP